MKRNIVNWDMDRFSPPTRYIYIVFNELYKGKDEVRWIQRGALFSACGKSYIHDRIESTV